MQTKALSALATIRKATGMTARDFGAAIGASNGLVIQMEKGDRAISPPVAAKVMAATGADSDALRQGKARCLAGLPYTAESYKQWSEAGGGEGVVATLADRAAEMVRALVLASAEDSSGRRHPGRFHSVSLKLSMALDELVAGYGLLDGANLQLSSRITQHEPRRVPVAEAKALYGRSGSWPEIEKRIGKAQTVEICEATVPVWTRLCGRAAVPDGPIALGESLVLDRVSATVRLPGSSSRPVPVAPFFRSNMVLLMREVQAARKGTTFPAPLIRCGGATAKIRSAGRRRMARS